MKETGLRAIRPKPKLSITGDRHPVYPYLLRNLSITRPGQVWVTNITYVPMAKGHMYLMAIMDRYSRYVVNCSLSSTMDIKWVGNVVKEAIAQHGAPETINSDQGAQFTSEPCLALSYQNFKWEAFSKLLPHCTNHSIKIILLYKGFDVIANIFGTPIKRYYEQLFLCTRLRSPL